MSKIQKNKKRIKKKYKEEIMNLNLISKNKFRKGMLVLGGFILATNFTYSAPVTDTVGVEFTIHDTLIVNTTSTNLDFGNVPITPGKVTAPENATLTISGTTVDTSVTVTVPNNLTLKNGNSLIPFTPILDGSAGSATTSGDNLVWTAESGFAASGDEIVLAFGGEIVLTGTEIIGDYQEIATINVEYN